MLPATAERAKSLGASDSLTACPSTRDTLYSATGSWDSAKPNPPPSSEKPDRCRPHQGKPSPSDAKSRAEALSMPLTIFLSTFSPKKSTKESPREVWEHMDIRTTPFLFTSGLVMWTFQSEFLPALSGLVITRSLPSPSITVIFTGSSSGRFKRPSPVTTTGSTKSMFKQPPTMGSSSSCSRMTTWPCASQLGNGPSAWPPEPVTPLWPPQEL
mmetsp:Transcript_26309/g.54960  ORF Transcript_26309/g.54960 Transcript_26309/m.54960 type:complete len:213 (-) Transcript_26309:705-1343(-)